MGTDQWDDFSKRILSPEDKLLFNEVVLSIRAGALRAAYIMIWISCAESFKRKFKELSARDATAKKIYGECERKEKDRKSIDHFILDEAKEYGLISTTEFTKLEQIYVFRCIYGHPYETAPSEENVISAASDVISTVLSKPTKLRHGFLLTQIDHLTTNISFLDDRWEASERFAIEVFQKCDNSLHLWFLNKLFEKTEPFFGDKSFEVYFRRAIWFSIAYLREFLKITPHPWSAMSELLAAPNIVSQVLATPDLFTKTDTHSKEQVVGIIIGHTQASPNFLIQLKTLNDAGHFDDRMKSRFQEAINKCQIEDLAAIRIDPNLYIERVITRLKSHDWYTQNPAVNVVKNIGLSEINRLPVQTQSLLGNNILQAAEGNATAAVSFLNSLAANPSQCPEGFINGIITECFVNEVGQIRFKKTHLTNALQLLKKLDILAANQLLDHLVARIVNGQLKTLVCTADRDATVVILKQFLTEAPQYNEKISKLIVVLDKLTIKGPFD